MSSSSEIEGDLPRTSSHSSLPAHFSSLVSAAAAAAAAASSVSPATSSLSSSIQSPTSYSGAGSAPTPTLLGPPITVGSGLKTSNSSIGPVKVKRTRQRVDAGEPRNSYASIANFSSTRAAPRAQQFFASQQHHFQQQQSQSSSHNFLNHPNPFASHFFGGPDVKRARLDNIAFNLLQGSSSHNLHHPHFPPIPQFPPTTSNIMDAIHAPPSTLSYPMLNGGRGGSNTLSSLSSLLGSQLMKQQQQQQSSSNILSNGVSSNNSSNAAEHRNFDVEDDDDEQSNERNEQVVKSNKKEHEKDEVEENSKEQDVVEGESEKDRNVEEKDEENVENVEKEEKKETTKSSPSDLSQKNTISTDLQTQQSSTSTTTTTTVNGCKKRKLYQPQQTTKVRRQKFVSSEDEELLDDDDDVDEDDEDLRDDDIDQDEELDLSMNDASIDNDDEDYDDVASDLSVKKSSQSGPKESTKTNTSTTSTGGTDRLSSLFSMRRRYLEQQRSMSHHHSFQQQPKPVNLSSANNDEVLDLEIRRNKSPPSQTGSDGRDRSPRYRNLISLSKDHHQQRSPSTVVEALAALKAELLENVVKTIEMTFEVAKRNALSGGSSVGGGIKRSHGQDSPKELTLLAQMLESKTPTHQHHHHHHHRSGGLLESTSTNGNNIRSELKSLPVPSHTNTKKSIPLEPLSEPSSPFLGSSNGIGGRNIIDSKQPISQREPPKQPTPNMFIDSFMNVEPPSKSKCADRPSLPKTSLPPPQFGPFGGKTAFPQPPPLIGHSFPGSGLNIPPGVNPGAGLNQPPPLIGGHPFPGVPHGVNSGLSQAVSNAIAAHHLSMLAAANRGTSPDSIHAGPFGPNSIFSKINAENGNSLSLLSNNNTNRSSPDSIHGFGRDSHYSSRGLDSENGGDAGSEDASMNESSLYDPNMPLTSTLTPRHLRKAKLMFFYVRYPSSSVLKMFFPDIKFNKNNTAQLVKWFSNFREFYYIQMEKYARQAVAEGINRPEEIVVNMDAEIIRVLNLHYNRNNHIEVPEHFRFVVEQTLREFFKSIIAGKDSEQSWKKAIYKIIARLDENVPEYFKSPTFLDQLE